MENALATVNTNVVTAVKGLKIAVQSGNSTGHMMVDLNLTLGGALELIKTDADIRRRLGDIKLEQYDVMVDSNQISREDAAQLNTILPDGAIIFLCENVEGA